MIGWVLLSRQAVSRAAEALSDNDRGVRDEVGFLAIHQAISDRLFPGTSVLHTRARYALLVPWLLRHVAMSGEGDLERRLLRAEATLAGQLVLGQDQGLDAKGAIGAEVWRQRKSPPAQPPSFSYWSALSAWGILIRSSDGTTPRRLDVLRQLSRATPSRRSAEDDPDPASGSASPFVALPPAPTDLGDRLIALDLALTQTERRFLRGQMIGVFRADGAMSLLARLADARAGGAATAPWDDAVVALADKSDREILKLASETAALAAIGRGAYATLVEQAWNADGQRRSHVQADALEVVRTKHADMAAGLDVDRMASLFPKIPSDLVDILRATQTWLRQGPVSPEALKDRYAAAEGRRKGDRARLTATYGGRRRRDEWRPDKHPLPTPLGYRWHNVSGLLRDIAG